MGDKVTTENREGGGDVRITQREIYDRVGELRDDVRDSSAQIERVLGELARQGRDVRDHETRLSALELGAVSAATVAATVSTHGGQLAELRSRVDRSSWAPALIAGLIPTVLGALAVYVLIPQ